jgi:uncharacterized protein (DUF58 family)
MRVRLSAQVYRLLAIATLALFLGAAFARVDLVLVAVPCLLALLVGMAVDTAATYAVTHQVSQTRLFEGDVFTVTVTIVAHSTIPLLEILEPLPPSVEVVAGNTHAAFSLTAGQTVQWCYTLRCVRRSRFTLGHLYVRLHGRAGCLLREQQHDTPQPCAVYPRIVPLRRAVRPPRTQVYVGNYVSPAQGEGIEFGNIRPFAPGDQIKRLNWRASLRLHDLHVNDYHQERNADVVLMLDTLTNVGSPALNTLDLCVRVAASLAWAYVRRKDRVGLIAYGGAFRWLRPGVGRAHLQRLLDQLLEATVVFSYVTRDLALVPRRVLPPQALVIAISPLVDERFLHAVQDLQARAFTVLLLTVSPVEVTRAMVQPSPVNDLTCRLWALEREAQLNTLRQQGFMVLEWSPEIPLELVFATLTQRRHVRRRMAL